ncbi:MAG TPA: hypothetical protein VK956_06490, partial [Verrucomicrobium sp.]|nr:hypothetical protein [Verrucomicrobium sp.]
TYQLVTDQTSMVVLNDDAFARHGIDRQNQSRVAAEKTAQAVQSQAAPMNRQVDAAQPLTTSTTPSISPPRSRPAQGESASNGDSSGSSSRRSSGSWFPSGGGGGGAISPQAMVALSLFAGLALLSLRQRKTA